MRLALFATTGVNSNQCLGSNSCALLSQQLYTLFNGQVTKSNLSQKIQLGFLFLCQVCLLCCVSPLFWFAVISSGKLWK